MAKKFDRADKLKVLLEVGTKLASNMDLDSLLELIIKQTTRVMNADRSSLFLVDEKKGELWSKIAQGAEEIRFPLGVGIAGHVGKTGDIINIPDAYKDKRFNRAFDKQTGFKTKAILCVPLKTRRGEIVGVVQVLNKRDGGVFEEMDEEVLMALAGQAAVAITNARYHMEVLQKQKIEQDLQIAKTVQQSFLPIDQPKLEGFTFDAYYESAQEVGGDFYDYIPLSETELAILMGDVSGKGVPAALFMARLMSDFRFVSIAEDEPKDILARVNDLLVKRSRRGMFVTIVFIILNTEKRRLTLASAGHLPPLLAKEDGSIERLTVEEGSPLGIIGGLTFSQESYTLSGGETILLYTDGLLEARNPKGEEFGFKRINKVLKKNSKANLKAVKKAMEKDVSNFVKDTPQHDDLTYYLIRATKRRKAKPKEKKPGKSAPTKNKLHLVVPSDPTYLSIIRKNVDHMITGVGYTDKEMRKIILAVDEAMSNVIKHAYEHDTSKTIELDVSVGSGKLSIKIRDYGKKPDVSKIKPRDVADIRPGGLGTHFLKEVMSKVHYDTSVDVGTVLTLEKKLPSRSRST